MKRNEVPQDDVRAFGGRKKAVYAVDDDGRYAVTGSSGWEAEEAVLDQAIAHFERLAEDARERARAGQAAPLEFHMYDRRMDITLLAQSTGLFKWRVRRHLKPAVFARLDDRFLARYADALGIPVGVLKRVPDAD